MSLEQHMKALEKVIRELLRLMKFPFATELLPEKMAQALKVASKANQAAREAGDENEEADAVFDSSVLLEEVCEKFQAGERNEAIELLEIWLDG